MTITRPTINTMLFVFGSILPVLSLSVSAGEKPLWTTTNTQSLSGKTFRAVCAGSGPSLDLARREARESCLSAASQQLNTTIHAKSVAIETEKGMAFHSEVAEEQSFTGLSCTPGREFIEESQNQSRVWLECAFDITKAKAIDKAVMVSEEVKASWASVKSDQSIVPPQTTKNSGRYVSSELKTLMLSVIPRCDDLLVRGERPGRIVKCQSDPISITVAPDENEVIVRASGFVSKTIHFDEKREGSEYVQIFLVPAN